jgi:alkylhydroperoxidase/carboxymuconolactone decarboxylase family protein YurZ
MDYDAQKILSQFNEAMVDIRKTVPKEYEAFMKEKEAMLVSGKIPEKTKWLLLLVASTTQKCPVCIPRAVRHCLDAGWTKEEMLEACMVAVLVGGSSAMAYVTLVDKAIEQMKRK